MSASREYLKQGLFKLLKGYGYLEGTGEEYDEERDMYTIVYAPVQHHDVRVDESMMMIDGFYSQNGRGPKPKCSR